MGGTGDDFKWPHLYYMINGLPNFKRQLKQHLNSLNLRKLDSSTFFFVPKFLTFLLLLGRDLKICIEVQNKCENQVMSFNLAYIIHIKNGNNQLKAVD